MISQQLLRHAGRRVLGVRRHYAKWAAPKAPSTRRAERREQPRLVTGSRPRDPHDPRDLGFSRIIGLPAELDLKVLKRAGLLTVEPRPALTVLAKIKQTKNLTATIAHKLCADHQVSVSDLHFLARACLFSGDKTLAKQVMFAASALGHPESTLYLLRKALRQDERITARRSAYRSEELLPLRRHLQQLIAQKQSDAMVLHAQYLASTGDTKPAIAMLEEAIEKHGATTPLREDPQNMQNQYSVILFQDYEETKTESPWTLLAKLYQKVGSFEKAAKAFTMGAEKDDDPMAFQALATAMVPFSPKWLEYMTKAAASGSWTAASHIASFYTAPLGQIDPALRPEMRRLERGPKLDWHFRCWSVEGDQNYLRPAADFPGDDPPPNEPPHRVKVSPRQALALEWYEIAWRGQICFSDESDPKISLAMAAIINEALRQSKASRAPGSVRSLVEKTWYYTRQHLAFSEKLQEGLASYWAQRKNELIQLKNKFFP